MANNTVFIVLAGGKSERMGIAKGLLDYNNTYWILEQLDRISKTQITEVYIGLGFHYQDYFNAIPLLAEAQTHFMYFKEMKVRVVINPNPERGSFSTLQTVLQKIKTNQAVLISPIDIPIPNATVLNAIIEIENTIVLPNFEGKNGHPIKLSNAFWKSLTPLDPKEENTRLDFQIKKVNLDEITEVEVNDSSILKNLNTQNDWTDYLNSK
ncbi:NTP transferase domain-containing protein [Flavobacterium sp. WC2409]|jgi:CTP:molybdopterin cytidylyltransferase MocA|uniref:NTP transferase domain-containing protein n=1 Tax=Flavobacterium sp. WC2409 TaxID=3234139 RepID=A0AB39W4G8_9FLAO